GRGICLSVLAAQEALGRQLDARSVDQSVIQIRDAVRADSMRLHLQPGPGLQRPHVVGGTQHWDNVPGRHARSCIGFLLCTVQRPESVSNSQDAQLRAIGFGEPSFASVFEVWATNVTEGDLLPEEFVLGFTLAKTSSTFPGA